MSNDDFEELAPAAELENRKTYTMSETQFDRLLRACIPPKVISIHTGEPQSTQDSANLAWIKLGAQMGFDGTTAKPTKERRVFTAIPHKESS